MVKGGRIRAYGFETPTDFSRQIASELSIETRFSSNPRLNIKFPLEGTHRRNFSNIPLSNFVNHSPPPPPRCWWHKYREIGRKYFYHSMQNIFLTQFFFLPNTSHRQLIIPNNDCIYVKAIALEILMQFQWEKRMNNSPYRVK